MPYLLDTDVAIHLRDKDEAMVAKVAAVDGPILLSIVSRVELEGGVYRDPAKAIFRRTRLDVLMRPLSVLVFDDACADAYRGIVEAAGIHGASFWIV